ncbi:nucleoside transporter-domain-containing protein [Mycena floridula]|nr:nucleoside transporter-domain-containing protein [Mycena floridula]
MTGSPELLYHPIPQGPVAANPILPDNEGDVELPVELTPRIRWIQFLLGCAVLLPWNVMITATPFFLSRLTASPLKPAFSSYMSTSFTASNFMFLAHATASAKQASPSRRIIMALICLSCLTGLLALSAVIRFSSSGLFFAFVLLNGMMQAGCGAYLQTSVVAIASRFGPTAMQTIMSGQAAVAVTVSSVQVVSAIASTWGQARSQDIIADKEPEERAAFIFFGLSTIFLLFMALAQRSLTANPSYRAVVRPLETKEDTSGADSEETRGLVSAGPAISFDKGRILRVAKANLSYEIAGAYVFVVTLAVFPPITTSIQSTNPATHPLLFSAVHFLVFACGDLLGRSLCALPKLLVWSRRRLLVLSVARTAFVPLFLMCNVQRPSSGSIPISSPIISSDWLFMMILLAFGTSNGYVSSMCMMAAPSVEHNPRLRGRRDDVDIAATVASFCLVGGLALGSMASFAVRGAICNCNPFTA